MMIKGWIKNIILSLAILTVMMSSVEHFSSLAESCVITETVSATGENVCAQKVPFESYALSRDNTYGLIKSIITAIKSVVRVDQQLRNRAWYSSFILFVIYLYLFFFAYLTWSSDTYISVTTLRTIRHIHLKDGQK